MKIWDYLGVTPERFNAEYVNTGLVKVSEHPEFPLSMFTYGREAVHSDNWDTVVRKCRGVIWDKETLEVIARPFEKFFNLRTAGMPETDPSTWSYSQSDDVLFGEPEVGEKMDGFLITLYPYKGKWYAASKGSFDSPHAKWATAWYHMWMGATKIADWPEGYTPVFEGLNQCLRIVVDYGKRDELVLLALINIETGEEIDQTKLKQYAKKFKFETPTVYDFGWEQANHNSLHEDITNFEGYVLVWRRPGQTPFRLKVKYVDYLRLHRMVSGVSPKAILQCLAGEGADSLQEWMNESTPWFNKFVTKWVRALKSEYEAITQTANREYAAAQSKLADFAEENCLRPAMVRKAFAEEFARSKRPGLLFAMYDGKDVPAVAWKMVRPMIKNSRPMIDAHNT